MSRFGGPLVMQPTQIDQDLTRLLLMQRGGPKDAADEASLLWGPVDAGAWRAALYAYPDPNVYVVVISELSEARERHEVGLDSSRLEPVPGSPDPSPMLAAGWVRRCEELLARRSPDDAPSAGRTLQSLLFSFPRRSSLFFTGAGAAAGVAQVLACWAKESFPSMWISTRTFAGPVIGTRDFLDYAELNLDEVLDWKRSLDPRLLSVQPA